MATHSEESGYSGYSKPSSWFLPSPSSASSIQANTLESMQRGNCKAVASQPIQKKKVFICRDDPKVFFF